MNKVDIDHLVGKKVGSSTLLKEMARGGMGAVFIAYQDTLKRQIAVKILPKSIITPTMAQIFQQEAESAAILAHPNIIQVYEIGDGGDFLYFTMQLVKGKSLAQYIKMARKNVIPSKRSLPVKTVIEIMIDVLNALDYAHSQDIVHRDIKPGNILIESHTKRPIIADFGLAQVSRNLDETSAMIVGTPMYMAPEQIVSPEVDGRVDIYAAATMMFEMLTPEPLFLGINSTQTILKMKMEQNKELFSKKPSDMNPRLNEEMDQILLKALSFDPETRHATCREFREKLEQYMGRYLKS